MISNQTTDKRGILLNMMMRFVKQNNDIKLSNNNIWRVLTTTHIRNK